MASSGVRLTHNVNQNLSVFGETGASRIQSFKGFGGITNPHCGVGFRFGF